MCGIYGMVSLSETLQRPDLADAMGTALRHRGPDARGALCARNAIFGCERLRIVDPDPRADQPFRDETRAFWLVCNGEIYNASELRERSPSYRFRTRSDVEPLLPLLTDESGGGLDEVNGMYALALWNTRCRTLTLARDPAGEKPLFYAEIDNEIWFASEIQALLVHPRIPRRIDEQAVEDYLAFGYVREPRTPIAGIRRVPAGTALKFNADGTIETTRHAVAASPAPASRLDRVKRLRHVLEAAVERQLVADVPVGVFTSGGIDSSLIVALAARHAPDALSTFTARFSNPEYDESGFARYLAHHVGTRHAEVRIDFPALHDARTELIRRIAEPMADPAILPTHLLARRARESVGVVLCGDGADELFGGYPTYLGHRLAGIHAALPAPVRFAAMRLSRRRAASANRVPLGYLLNRFSAYAGLPFAERHVSWFGTGLLPYFPRETSEAVLDRLHWPAMDDSVASARRLDHATYLRDGLLVKLDRVTMLHGLEARSPFLDRHVQALAWGLLPRDVLAALRTKPLLKTAATGLVPSRLIHRRKRGFSVPIAGWLRGHLREEVEDIVRTKRFCGLGVLNELPIGELWVAHRDGRANHAKALWAVVMLYHWLDHWIVGERG